MMASNRLVHERFPAAPSRLLILGPLLFMLVVSLYALFRTGGYWAETDSATFTNVLRTFTSSGELTPDEGEIYPNGVSFQAISAYVVSLTGLDVLTLQQLAYPLVAPLVALPAWALYRELTGSARGAAIATMLLFTQPEFLFVILRSSHEKFTRTLMLFCLFLLVRSFKLGEHPQWFAAYVGMFHIAVFALIASNNLIAHSFIFALILAVSAGRLIQKRSRTLMMQNRVIFQRLQYALLTSIALVYVFTFYLYPPALHEISVLRSIWDQVATLFLNTESSTTFNAYGTVTTGWLSLPIFFLVSIANWLILALSFGIWSWNGFSWIVRSKAPESQTALLVWLLYAAFALQGVLSVVADYSGALAGNMQQRLFPSYSIFAVAIVASSLSRWRPRRFTSAIRVTLATVICGMAFLSVFKATNEPLVSNGWTLYRPTELAAVEWSDAHIENRSIWTDYNERLAVAFETVNTGSANNNWFDRGIGLSPTTRDIVVTDLIRLRSRRLDLPLPQPPDALRVYDNGQAEVYHLRPETPFQP